MQFCNLNRSKTLANEFLKFNKIIRFYNFENRKKLLEMNEVYFKHNIADAKMLISFRYLKQVNETKKLDRNFNFVRNIDENIDTALNRIKCNLEKEFLIKSKKKTKKNTDTVAEEKEDVKVRLFKYFEQVL